MAGRGGRLNCASGSGRGWPAVALALAAGSIGASCAVAPPPSRTDPPVVAPKADARQIAQRVDMRGRSGRLSPAQREQLLQRVGRQGSATLLNTQLAAMAIADEAAADGGVELQAQNRATLLIDGPQTFAAMFQAIERARHTVLLQSYIVDDTAIAEQLAALLARKRAQGVQVALLYDALGSIGTDPAFFERLRAQGVPVCATNPVNPVTRPGYWNMANRDHRKILSVDRQTGFTGGINISAVYSSGSFGRGGGRSAARDPDAGWRDTQVQLQGPAVAALDDLVRATWRAQGCEPALPPAPPVAGGPGGDQLVRIVPASPQDGPARIYTLLLTAIDAAQRSVFLTMAYFAPGSEMVDALCDAARRGVDVQLVLPAHSDFAPVLYAGRSHYQRLLDAGVKIHELQDAVLHAKTAVIDGVVSTVGSSNMDWRSFSSNSEVNAVVFGENFGNAMARMFEADLRDSTAITPQAWARRSLWQRGKEIAARLFERWW